MVVEKKRAHDIWLMTKDTEDRKYYTHCCKVAKKAVLKAKKEIGDNRCRHIDQTIGYSRASEAWRTLKSLRTNRKDNAHIKLIPLENWKNYYQNLLTKDRPEFLIINNDETFNSETTFIEEDSITPTEVMKILMTMKNRRAQKNAGLPIEMLKPGSDVLLQLLAFVF
ncbi:hypothetical protein ILUMI_03816 [Ignelater luminosus]|uniref:Uncharacterized protein n=1 Tax=Ignelater luminosus TaxID=2038154 RepID=A0A8K0GF55_IGNLU|nr:hypothetical protein ILUMI_03816 [Ignelater luminosus]